MVNHCFSGQLSDSLLLTNTAMKYSLLAYYPMFFQLPALAASTCFISSSLSPTQVLAGMKVRKMNLRFLKGFFLYRRHTFGDYLTTACL